LAGRGLVGRGLGAAASGVAPRRCRAVRQLGTAARRQSRLGAAARVGVPGLRPAWVRPARLCPAARRRYRSTGRSDRRRASRHSRGAHTGGAGERR
jgi:hypothetical protein